jgi:hypothetical protein
MPNPLSIVTRPLGLARSVVVQSFRLGQFAAGQAVALVRGGAEAAPAPEPQPERRPQPKPGMDDVTLARKVETELFRSPRSPKATVDVNVVEGVVQLRGTVKTPNMIKTLEARARAIPEVRDVDNLLHLVRTDASTRTDTSSRARTEGPVPSKRTSRSSTARRAATRRAANKPRVATNEAPPAVAEPGPDELAPRRRGRQPAPLGAEGGGDGGTNGAPSTTGGPAEGAPSTTGGPAEGGSSTTGGPAEGGSTS